MEEKENIITVDKIFCLKKEIDEVGDLTEDDSRKGIIQRHRLSQYCKLLEKILDDIDNTIHGYKSIKKKLIIEQSILNGESQ